MEKLFFFGGSPNDCWKGSEKKGNTSKSDSVLVFSGEFQRLKKSKEGNLEGDHF